MGWLGEAGPGGLLRDTEPARASQHSGNIGRYVADTHL